MMLYRSRLLWASSHGLAVSIPSIPSILSILAMLVLCAGCAKDWEKVRHEETDRFRGTLDQAAAVARLDDRALGLSDCVALALENNLAIKTAGIEARIAKLRRQAAFAEFLPTVSVDLNYTALDRQPETQMLGLLSQPVQDQRVLQSAWQVQMPIFVPELWFLYLMHRRGAEISELAAQYARDMVATQVTMAYFHCLALDETIDALRSQVEAAASLSADLNAFHEEGLIPAWQAERGEVLLLARRLQLERCKLDREEAAAGLLTAMGLSPLAGLKLAVEMPLTVPEAPLEERVLEALLNHPQLRIADRNVSIQKQRARVAIAAFLPKLMGFSSRTHTSDSFMKFPDMTALGVAGVMTVFNGLKDVREYQVARQQKQAAFLQREEACFTIMLSVIRAHNSVSTALNLQRITGMALEVFEARLAEAEAQWREGLIGASERLELVAERDGAEMQAAQMRFQVQVSIATLRNVMGKPYAIDEEEDVKQ